MKEHPFATGVAVGALGLLAWWKRGAIIALFRRAAHPFSGGFGLGDDHPALATLPSTGDPNIAVRQIKRYAFASMQDKSPIVGLTHASYALVLMDTLEEMVGRDAIKRAGFDPLQVRAIITKLQDKHAQALQSCDPYISQVLALEKQDGGSLPGFVMAGSAWGAPTGA